MHGALTAQLITLTALLILAFSSAPSASADGLTLCVATDGLDENSGSRDAPFATLERARDEIRKIKAGAGLPAGGVTVELAAGIYECAQTFELTADDSGTAEAPIVYRARPGDYVRLTGGRLIGDFALVEDAQVLEQLAPAARGKVLQADLKAQGIDEFGEPIGGWGQPQRKYAELFFNGRPMQISRWPNEGFAKIVDILGEEPRDVRGTKGDSVGKFKYEGDRPKRWAREKDLWVHGWWFWDWAEQRHPVDTIDLDQRIISVKRPYHTFGYRKGQWWYAFNALSEIDMPGEWFLDREAGILYFWPPGEIREDNVMVSVLPGLLRMEETSFVTIQGMTLECVRSNAFSMKGGTRNRIAACTIRNAGSYAGSISGGTENGIIGCDIYDTGDGGVTVSGGDRPTLTPANNYVENCHIHHYSRWNRILKPAINISGVGQRVRHNLIHDAPHKAMLFSGNEHLIELNEMHSVVYEANDAGAIYAGYNWTMRGNIIRHNYFHHIQGFRGLGCVGVYLDDMFSSAHIYGNVFYKVRRAAFIGGGRDTTIEGNLFVDCNPALHVDARAMGWAAHAVEGSLKTRLDEMPYKNELWSKRYPGLVNTWEDEPAAPKGNVIARNVCYGGQWDEIEGKARPYLTLQDNFVELGGEMDATNFQLRADHPAYSAGFKPIPFGKIGLYEDELRASWPVIHEVRPIDKDNQTVGTEASAPIDDRNTYAVPRSTAPITVDGIISSEEWGGLDPSRAMVIAEGLKREAVAPRSTAWLAWDDTDLFIAVDNAVDPSQPLRPGDTWGSSDAVEIAIRNPAPGVQSSILILRGYPSGNFASSDEAGAPHEAVARAAEGVEYAARTLSPARWTVEWRIPFASLGIDPAKHRELPFNISVRKTGGPHWVLWQGTNHATWNVDKAGTITLAE